MTAGTLNDAPIGVPGLVLDVLGKVCLNNTLPTVLSLLALLTQAKVPFSDHFFDYLIDESDLVSEGGAKLSTAPGIVSNVAMSCPSKTRTGAQKSSAKRGFAS